MSGKLFVISAPSGAGKTTLAEKVLEHLSSKYPIGRVVTYTSRVARQGEKNGQDYNFVSSQEFEQKMKDGFFLEWSGEYGHYYGTPRHIVDDLAQGFSRILIIDRLGARRIFEIAKDASPTLTNMVTSIWIFPPSISELEKRLVGRAKDTTKQIEKRLALAQKELQEENTNPLYDHTILNDDFSEAMQKLEALLICELEK